MAETGLVQIIEGAILAAGKPMTVQNLAELFEEHERPDNADIRAALKEVAERCDDRGYQLQEVSSGFRFQVRQELSQWIARLWVERPTRYSRALLETLALIAYRQPITRGEIEEIRGVAVSSSIIKTLHEREWIRVVGHRDVPGRPAMYATTRSFLDYFNLKNLEQLPALAEIRDLETLTAELGFEPLPEFSANDGAQAPAAESNEEPVAEQEPSAGLNEEPSAGLNEAPAAEQEPSADLNEEPAAELNEAPAAEQEPSAELNEAPAAEQEPSAELNEAPAAEQEPSADLNEEPSAELNEEPIDRNHG